VFCEVVFLILETLGSTELLFILVMALIFFGPRSLGKNIAEFKRASEEFKRTWDKEVSLEETVASSAVGPSTALPAPNSILDNAPTGRSLQSPTIEPIAPDRVIARHSIESDTRPSAAETDSASEQTDFDGVADEAQLSRKQDWL
jgi:Sec-independent protein translocase protein TatA